MCCLSPVQLNQRRHGWTAGSGQKSNDWMRRHVGGKMSGKKRIEGRKKMAPREAADRNRLDQIAYNGKE